MSLLIIFFWIAAFIVFYTYIGYGLLLFIWVKIKERIKKPAVPALPPEKDLPAVTLFIAAYNEREIARAKMENSLELDYPPHKLTILWVTDGSDDGTTELLRQYTSPDSQEKLRAAEEKPAEREPAPFIRVEHVPQRGGKAAAFNRGIAFVTTPIVIFTDANTMLNKEAVKEIVRQYSDPAVGCVAGEKRVEESAGKVAAKFGIKKEREPESEKRSGHSEPGRGEEVLPGEIEKKDAARTEGIYWKYESFLKALDYKLYSTVGAAGELFSIRTELFEKLSSDTLLDDFILSMRIASKGYKIAYCSNAYAVEGASANIREEGKRKVRIAAGGLQSVGRLLPLLNIFKYGILSFQYISHRVLRWTAAPLALLLLLPLNIGLVALQAGIIYEAALLLQVTVYIMGLAGWLLSGAGRKNKVLYVAYYFLFMNYNVFRGIVYLARRKNNGIWEKARRA